MQISQQPETGFILIMWLSFLTNINKADDNTWDMTYLV